MKKLARFIGDRCIGLIDFLLIPFVLFSAWLLKRIRREGVHKLPRCRNVFLKVGMFPIRNHFYEPQFDYRDSKRNFAAERDLPGINWNLQEQLELLGKLTFVDELNEMPVHQTPERTFYFNNPSFGPGDADFWYQIIRLRKPKRIIEIGSGNSTLMAINGIQRNRLEDERHQCELICIEPFETPWLEETGVKVIREKVEDVEKDMFRQLESDDILFIDSSHVIRPDGDVLCEYLEILPSLKKGVIVHIHDIYSPRNYPDDWIRSEVRLWNEQYILEAFLSHNCSFKIIGALNLLYHRHYDEFHAVCRKLPGSREPGSFYIEKIR